MNPQTRLLRYAFQAWTPLVITIFAGSAGGVLLILQARLLSILLYGVFLSGLGIPTLYPLFWALGLVIISRGFLIWLEEGSATVIAIRIKTQIRIALLRKLTQLGPAHISQEETGELTAVISQGVEALDAFFSQYLPQLVFAVMIPLTILLVVFPQDLLTFLVFIITAPLIPIFMVLIGKKAEVETKRQFITMGRMSAFFLDTIKGLVELKLLGQTRQRGKRIEKVSEEYRETTMDVLKITFLSALILELVGTLSVAIIAVEIGLRLLHGDLAFDQAFLILLLAPEFYLPLRMLGQRFHAGLNGVTAAVRIFSILDQEVPTNRKERIIRAVLPKPPYMIRFENITYRYQNREKNALELVNLIFRPESQTALVGKSGSGKSTLVNILLGFVEPLSGKVVVNETCLEEIDIRSWRENIGWVPQSPFFFKGTLEENLRFAKPEASLEEMVFALRSAQLGELEPILIGKVDKQLGSQGVGLSGGQLQRLAIARVFLKNTPIVVMDEPTSNLDPEKEALLEEAFLTLARNRTLIIIAHRIPTIYRSDQIIIFEGGKVVESGRPQDLAKESSVYRHFVINYSGKI